MTTTYRNKVYILTNERHTVLYVGVTSDIQKRLISTKQSIKNALQAVITSVNKENF